MVSIRKAVLSDYSTIIAIGLVSVEEAHRDSCSPADMQTYLQQHYNDAVIKKELQDPANHYYIIYVNDTPAGFSKLILHQRHTNIEKENVAKLDRIYLLGQFQGLQLGLKLLQFNIHFARQHGESAIWLFTWIGNKKAIDFYIRAGFTIIGSHWFRVSETHSNLNHHMLLNLS